MTMSQLEWGLSQILLFFIPEPLFWMLLFVAIFAIALYSSKAPSTVAASFSFILVWILADYMGGIMQVLHMLMLAGMGILFVLTVIKIGNR